MDVSKHIMVFDPGKVKGKIAIAGLGSIGSAVALNLAKLGLSGQFILFDDDVVDSHNIANQVLYGPDKIGEPKVFAADDMIGFLTDKRSYLTYTQKLESRSGLDKYNVEYLFVCVDSMVARMEIFDKCVWMNPNLKYFADGRMSARYGMCYGFDPTNMPKSKEYRKRLYPDSDVPDEVIGGCSITPSIGATAMFIATQMTWMFINHVNGGIEIENLEGKKSFEKPFEEIAFRVDNLEVHTKGWL